MLAITIPSPTIQEFFTDRHETLNVLIDMLVPKGKAEEVNTQQAHLLVHGFAESDENVTDLKLHCALATHDWSVDQMVRIVTSPGRIYLELTQP